MKIIKSKLGFIFAGLYIVGVITLNIFIKYFCAPCKESAEARLIFNVFAEVFPALPWIDLFNNYNTITWGVSIVINLFIVYFIGFCFQDLFKKIKKKIKAHKTMQDT